MRARKVEGSTYVGQSFRGGGTGTVSRRHDDNHSAVRGVTGFHGSNPPAAPPTDASKWTDGTPGPVACLPRPLAPQRAVDLPDGDMLRWVFIDDPAHRRPHAECFRTDRRGNLHPTEARRLLDELGHPDAAFVRLDTHVGRSISH